MVNFFGSKTDFNATDEKEFDKLLLNIGLTYLNKHKQKIRKELATEFISYEYKSSNNDLVHINCEKYYIKNYNEFYDITENNIKVLNLKEFKEGFFYIIEFTRLLDGSNSGYKRLNIFMFRLESKIESDTSTKFIFSEDLYVLIKAKIDEIIRNL